jgi:hypothetical protein
LCLWKAPPAPVPSPSTQAGVAGTSPALLGGLNISRFTLVNEGKYVSSFPKHQIGA